MLETAIVTALISTVAVALEIADINVGIRVINRTAGWENVW